MSGDKPAPDAFERDVEPTPDEIAKQFDPVYGSAPQAGEALRARMARVAREHAAFECLTTERDALRAELDGVETLLRARTAERDEARKALAEARTAALEALGDADGQCGESLFWLGMAYGQALTETDRKEYTADKAKIEAKLRAVAREEGTVETWPPDKPYDGPWVKLDDPKPQGEP